MDSLVWNTLIGIQNMLEQKFDLTGTEVEEHGMQRFNQPGWVNRVWTSKKYRRAHIDVVDARSSKGLWMMHCCIFPHLHNSGPIYGFDVVAGKNKITGCFHDFSSGGDANHLMIQWFGQNVKGYEWTKERALPDWAKNIFSSHMVAAGNVHKEIELDTIEKMVGVTTDYYLSNIGLYNNSHSNTKEFQNFYCLNQKKNPHTPRVMSSLGLDYDDVSVFIEECLFPDIK